MSPKIHYCNEDNTVVVISPVGCSILIVGVGEQDEYEKAKNYDSNFSILFAIEYNYRTVYNIRYFTTSQIFRNDRTEHVEFYAFTSGIAQSHIEYWKKHVDFYAFTSGIAKSRSSTEHVEFYAFTSGIAQSHLEYWKKHVDFYAVTSGIAQSRFQDARRCKRDDSSQRCEGVVKSGNTSSYFVHCGTSQGVVFTTYTPSIISCFISIL